MRKLIRTSAGAGCVATRRTGLVWRVPVWTMLTLVLACWSHGASGQEAENSPQAETVPAGPEAVATPSAPAESERLDPEVLTATLDFELDLNGDGVPDGWQRLVGTPGYPHYVPARSDGTVVHHGSRSLRFDLRSGNVAFETTPLAIDPDFVYVLSGWIRTEGVDEEGIGAAGAWVVVRWLDESKHIIRTTASTMISGTTDWQEVGLSSGADAAAEDVRFAVIRCELVGRDTAGTVWFDDLVFVRLPKVTVEPTAPAGLFYEGETPTVSLTVRGLAEGLFHAGFSVDGLGVAFARNDELEVGISGSEVFRKEIAVPVELYGCYEVWAKLRYEAPELAARSDSRVAAEVLKKHLEVSTRFAYLRKVPSRRAAAVGIGSVLDPFALSPRSAARTAQNEATVAGVTALGLDYLKVLPWNAQATVSELQQEMARATELIMMLPTATEPVVVMSRPSLDVVAETTAGLADAAAGAPAGMADVFLSPASVWNVLVNDTVNRLAGHVSSYQLGADGDDSFSTAGFAQSVSAAASAITPLWPGSRLGVPIDIVSAPEGLDTGEQKFISFDMGDIPAECIPLYLPYFRSPELRDWYLTSYFGPTGPGESTAGETLKLLAAPETGRKDIWAYLPLVPFERYGRLGQATDMAKRFVFCRLSGVDTVFVGPLVDDETGLLDTRVIPTPAFVAMHTLSSAIGGLDLVFANQTEHGSTVSLFSGGPEGVIVAWNSSGTVGEELPIGPESSVIDLWGNVICRGTEAEVTPVMVGPRPIIIGGILPGIFEIAESVVFESNQLDSTIEAQELSFSFTNGFPHSLEGTLSFVVPDTWVAIPKHFDLSLDPGAKFNGNLRVMLPVSEPVGEREINVVVAFDLKGKAHRISHPKTIAIVSRTFDVTTDLVLGDKDMTIVSKVTNNSEDPLEVTGSIFYGKRSRVGPRSLGIIEPGQTRSLQHTILSYHNIKEPDLHICLRPRNDKRFYNRRVTFREGAFYVLSD